MRALGLVIALALVTIPAQGQSAQRDAAAHLERGVGLQQKGDLQGARVEYEAALKSVPRLPDALSNLGVIYAHMGQYDEAIKYYNRALDVAPLQHDIRLNLGIAYFKTSQFELAQRELAKVVAAEPNRDQARLLLGLCDFQLNKLTEAAAEIELVYRRQPDNVGAAYALASTYISLNQLARAQELIDKVFRQLGTAETHLLMGSLSVASKDFTKAIEELTQAEQLNPRLPTLHSQLGNAYLFSGDRERAIKEFVAELENNPRDFDANLRLGVFYREDGRLDEAEAMLKKALGLRPNEPFILYQLAQLAQTKGANEEAVKLLEAVVKQMPDFTQAHVLLARLYFKLKRTAEAEREKDVISRLNAEQQKKQPTPKPEEAPQAATPR